MCPCEIDLENKYTYANGILTSLVVKSKQKRIRLEVGLGLKVEDNEALVHLWLRLVRADVTIPAGVVEALAPMAVALFAFVAKFFVILNIFYI